MPISPLGFPLDLTGQAVTNLITGETHEFLTGPDRIFVPDGGPFYVVGLQVRHGVTNELLAPLTDYKVLHLVKDAAMESRKEVCAVISVHNTAIPSVTLQYQIIGGHYGETAAVIRQLLEDNPPIAPVVWGQIIGAPVQFTPAAHLTDAKTIFGLGPLVSVLERMRSAIATSDEPAFAAVYQYLNMRMSDFVTEIELTAAMDAEAATRLLVDNTLFAAINSLIPTPPAADKVLKSTGNAQGDWTWGDSILTAPYYNEVVLVPGDGAGNWNGAEAVTLMPIGRGLVTIDGVVRQLLSPITIPNSALTADKLTSIFLYWDGSALQLETFKLDPLEVVAANIVEPKRHPVTRQVVKYVYFPSQAYDTSRLFVGHAYRNDKILNVAYRNIYSTYVRSYFNDYGTGVGNVGILGGSGTHYSDPGIEPLSVAEPCRGHYMSARLTDDVIGSDANYLTAFGTAGHWGWGADPGQIPYGDYLTGLDPTVVYGSVMAQPPSNELVVGHIAWPFEVCHVRGQFELIWAQSNSRIALRAWNRDLTVRSNASGIMSSLYGHIVQNAYTYSTINTQTARRVQTLETPVYTELLEVDPVSTVFTYNAKFLVFDAIWNGTCFGSNPAAGLTGRAGSTRLDVIPSIENARRLIKAPY